MQWRRHPVEILLVLCLCLLLLPGKKAHAEESSVLLLGVEINGQPQDRIVTALRQNDNWALAEDDVKALRLEVGDARPILFEDKKFIPLSAIRNVKMTIDEADQVMKLDAEANSFQTSNLSANREFVKPSPAQDAAFVNYDLLAQGDGTGKTLGGSFETGGSGDFGIVDNTMTATNSGHSLTRLETAYTSDLPDDMDRVALGDSTTRVSSAGSPLRFAGVQFGRNFGLQPGFVAFPTPTLQGEAALPSTVDVYVNNALRYSSDVAPGPFTIDRLPTITGAGETTLVVRDPLGRETVTQGNFYTTQNLLKEGLWDYSYSGGLERENFGANSFDYQTPFASTLTRYGLTDALTNEFEADGSGPGQVVGDGFAFLLPGVGQAQVSEAVSSGDSKRGGSLTSAGISRIGSDLSFSLDAKHAFGGFTQLGDTPEINHGLWQFDSSFGVSMNSYGNITLGFTELERTQQHNTNIASLSYGLQMGNAGYFTAGVASVNSGTRSTTVSVTFTVPLGEGQTAGVETDDRDGRLTNMASYSAHPSTQRGFGGALSVGEGQQARDDGTVTWDGNQGSALAEVSHTSTGTGERLGLTGGLAALNDDVYASRRLDDAFALVSVPDHPDVRIYRNNLEIGRTDDDGDVLVSGLLPYQKNQLSLDIGDIPINASMTGDTVDIVPQSRSGVVATFDVQSTDNLVITLLQSDGTAVPAGALIVVNGRADNAFVGFDGAVFLTNVVKGSVLEADWEGHTCRATLPEPQTVGDKTLGPSIPLTCIEGPP
jgi:outer membrane usher protein